jgi:hypothetical protein
MRSNFSYRKRKVSTTDCASHFYFSLEQNICVYMRSLYIDFLDSSRDKSTKTMAVAALPFTILLGHSNSAFNPLLYCAMNYHLHRRRRSQSQTPAPAGVAESKRPLKMAVAETGARAWHCRAAPLGKSSVNRNLPASREGQSQPANDVRKQNGVESNERVSSILTMEYLRKFTVVTVSSN